MNIPPMADNQSQLLVPGIVGLRAGDIRICNSLEKNYEMRVYTISSGQQNLEADIISPLNNSRVIKIKLDFDFLAGKTYAIIGEAKLSEEEYSIIDRGVRLYIIDATDNSFFHIQNPKKLWPADMVLSSDGSKIAFCTGKEIYVHCSIDGKLITKLTGHTDMITSVKFSSNSNLLYSSSDDKTVRVWDMAENINSSIIMSSKKKPYCTVWSVDSNFFAMMIGEQIEVYDTGTGQLHSIFTGHKQDLAPGRLAFSPDGSRILSCYNFGGTALYHADAIMWDIHTGEQITRREIKSGVLDIVWQPAGNLIALTRGGYDIKPIPPVIVNDALQEQYTLDIIPEISTDIYWLYCPFAPFLYFKPDGTEIFCITNGKSISNIRSGNVFDAETGKLKFSIASQTSSSSFYRAAYSPDGNRIALLSHDGIRVWNSDYS